MLLLSVLVTAALSAPVTVPRPPLAPPGLALPRAEVLEDWALAVGFDGLKLGKVDGTGAVVTLPRSDGVEYEAARLLPGGRVLSVTGAAVVLYGSDGRTIFAVRPDADLVERERLGLRLQGHLRIDASADGRRILVASTSEVWLYDGEGTLVWTRRGGAELFARISPDGSRVMIGRGPAIPQVPRLVQELSATDGSVLHEVRDGKVRPGADGAWLENTYLSFVYGAVLEWQTNTDGTSGFVLCQAPKAAWQGAWSNTTGSFLYSQGGAVFRWHGCGAPPTQVGTVAGAGDEGLLALAPREAGFMAMFGSGATVTLDTNYAPTSAHGLAWSPEKLTISDDGRIVGFTWATTMVGVVERDTRSLTHAWRVEVPDGVVVSPDGGTLLYGGARLTDGGSKPGARVDLATGAREELEDGGVTPAFAPDGRLLIADGDRVHVSGEEHGSGEGPGSGESLSLGCDLAAVGCDDDAIVGLCANGELRRVEAGAVRSLGRMARGQSPWRTPQLVDARGAGTVFVLDNRDVWQVTPAGVTRVTPGADALMVGARNGVMVLSDDALIRLRDGAKATISLREATGAASSPNGAWVTVSDASGLRILPESELRFVRAR